MLSTQKHERKLVISRCMGQFVWVAGLKSSPQTCVFSTVKWNQSRARGLAVSGRINRSYSWLVMKSTRPRFIVSCPPSKQMWPFLALPVWPGGRMTSRWMLFNMPSFSESVSAMMLLAQRWLSYNCLLAWLLAPALASASASASAAASYWCCSLLLCPDISTCCQSHLASPTNDKLKSLLSFPLRAMLYITEGRRRSMLLHCS